MRFIYENLKKGLRFAVFIVLLDNAVVEIINQGSVNTTDWRYIKLFIGAIVVSLGYSISSAIYMLERIPLAVKIIIQMLSGTIVFTITGYVCNWLSVDNNSYNLIVIIAQLVIAILYLTLNYTYNIKLIDDINRALKK